MMPSRTIVIVGAGIGGLTTALALVRHGFRVVLLEQTATVEEVGAGIQLTPNATRALIALGLGERLRQTAVVPSAIRIARARNGREIVRIPLGAAAELRYGAPYWIVHRADLQSALFAAANDNPDIEIVAGAKVADCAVHANGVSVAAMRGGGGFDAHGIALIGADGLWSTLRTRLGDARAPNPAQRIAWRALVPAAQVAPALREAIVHLWLGAGGHVVAYPVRAASMVNIVAIHADTWSESGWNAEGGRDVLLARFPASAWCAQALELLAAPRRWRKWALADRPPGAPWGRGPVTLVGDAAHPMLPFLAQGAAMAIEDAVVLADCMGRMPADPANAMRHYERSRRVRVARAQLSARANGRIYHLAGAAALMRDTALRAIGGKRLLHRYDWVYRFNGEAPGENGTPR
ncbi:MAG: FAD-dependent monooxygenase [Proteobacteria bacterium]|nr:FAD-dependent monooxygenase [Pseudomonadota bacterium]